MSLQSTNNRIYAQPIIQTPYDRSIGIFSDYLPRYNASSANLRVYEIVSSLVSAGYRVHYYWWLPTEEDAAYLEHFGNAIEFHPFKRSRKTILDAVRRHGLHQIWFTNLWGTDWITCAADAARNIRKQNIEVAVIADTMDYHCKKYYRKYGYTGDKADRNLADTFFDAERALYSSVDAVVTVTNTEARDIIRSFNTDTPLHVVGNIHRITPASVAFEKRRDFVFLGNYRVPHNVDAVRWFLDHVASKLQALLPGFGLHLVGKHAEELPAEIAGHSAVTVSGYVEDLPSQLAKYRVMVVPLSYGAGMKGKIGSAAACGLPVVSTSMGVEGYPFVDSEHCFIVDHPADFAERCAVLHSEEGVWNSMSAKILDVMNGALAANEIVGRLLRMTADFGSKQLHPSIGFNGVYSCRSMAEFSKVMSCTDRSNRIAIIEPTLSHQETFHSLIEYCRIAGFGADFILRSEARNSRDIIVTLSDISGIDIAFFHILNPETVDECVTALNAANHHAVFFNTLFEYWLQDGLMDSPYWAELEAVSYAYVHHKTKFDRSTVRYPVICNDNLFALSENVSQECGAALLSPSFFYGTEYIEAEESRKMRFVCVGGTGDQRRDYSQLVDACLLLNEQGFSGDYQVDIIGGDYTPNGDWTQKFNTNLKRYGLKANIILNGEKSFKELFSLICKSDYLLFLINMANPYSREYLNDKITGSLNLSLGFGVVPILDRQLAENWNLDHCAVVHEGYQGFLKAIVDIMQQRVSRQDMQRALRAKNDRLTAASADNFKRVMLRV